MTAAAGGKAIRLVGGGDLVGAFADAGRLGPLSLRTVEHKGQMLELVHDVSRGT